MEMILNHGMELTAIDKIYFLAANFKLINTEKLLSAMFENASHSDAAGYIGDLNKSDIML